MSYGLSPMACICLLWSCVSLEEWFSLSVPMSLLCFAIRWSHSTFFARLWIEWEGHGLWSALGTQASVVLTAFLIFFKLQIAASLGNPEAGRGGLPYSRELCPYGGIAMPSSISACCSHSLCSRRTRCLLNMARHLSHEGLISVVLLGG